MFLFFITIIAAGIIGGSLALSLSKGPEDAVYMHKPTVFR